MKSCDVCHATYPNEFAACPKDQSLLREVSELGEGMIIREKFQILSKVGEGPMGAVYVAKNLTFGETRALKVIHNKFAKNEAFVNLLKTVGVPRKLHHANACRIEDFDFAEDESPFLVMEYVEGKTLRTVLKESGALPAARAAAIARQVLAALETAHGLGITHRDIKPENIMLVTGADGSEQAKVLEFGMARVREGSLDILPMYGTTTKSGAVVGTPPYLSPEQALGKKGDDIDGRADIYSLGVVLYEMLAGQLPFSSATNVGMLVQHITGTPKSLRELKPELPDALADVVMKALQKDRNARYASAASMEKDVVAAVPEPKVEERKPAATKVGAAVMIRYEKETPTARPKAVMPPSAAVKTPTPAPGTIKTPPPKLRAATPGLSTETPTDLRRKESVGKGTAPSFGEVADTAPSSSKLPMVIGGVALVVVIALVALFLPKGKAAKAGNPQPTQQELADAQKTEDARTLVDVNGLLATSPSYAGVIATVDSGVVALAGKVETKQDFDRLTSIVRNTIGVKDVKNDQVQVDARFGKKEQQAAAASRPPTPRATARNVPVATTVAPPAATTATTAPPNQQQQKARALIAMGNRQLDAGDYQSAVNMFNTALSLDPGNAAAEAGLRRANEANRR